jgi:hypothetical protein
MNLKFAIATFALVMMAASAIAVAQDTSTRTLTGCLKKGPNVYSLTDENGKMWELSSKTVQLEPHVNQTVTVTGTVPQRPKSTGASGDSSPENEYRLRVTSLKTVNEGCEQR